MGGGLIQLITIGIQDSPIIQNPEITFFKTVYRQHTMFSLCQNTRHIDDLYFGKSGHKILEKNGDLLYNQCLKLEIPYFEIIKTYTNKNVIQSDYNINELSITYMNKNCIVINNTNNWYIIPEQLFMLGNFKAILTNIEASLVEPVLLPDYINLSNLDNNVYYYNIKESHVSSVITLLRVESNYWEQFWLDFLSNTTEDILLDSLQTLKQSYNNLYELLRFKIFYLYSSRNSYYKNALYLQFATNSNQVNEGGNIIEKTETERYIEYINDFSTTILNLDVYETDIIYNYCINNFKNFDNYKVDCLKYTPLVILLIYKMLYSDNKSIYTFWKQYSVLDNNDINNYNIIDKVNYQIEWQNNINTLINDTLNAQNINSIILDELFNTFFGIENYIVNLINNFNLSNSKNIYIKLKTFMSRFYSVPNNQLNFNDYYKPYYYIKPITISTTETTYYYNSDSYKQQLINETNKYSQLKKVNIDLLDEMNNLTPVNLENIFAIIAEDILNIIINNNNINNSIKSFIIFWRNLVVDRLYKKFIDIYQQIQTNPDFTNSNTRKLSYYFTFNPGNIITSNEIRNSWIEMFYKNSWIGNMSIGNNSFIKFKENLYNITKENITSVDTQINENKDFNKLQITNKYNYTITSQQNDTYINRIKIDYTLNKLIIKYDNYYDTKSIITIIKTSQITNKTTPILFNSIDYEIILNELNVNSIYLVFTLDKKYIFEDNDIITLNVVYTNYIPLVSFNESNILDYTSNKLMLLSKNSNNQLNLFNIVKANTLYNTTNNDCILVDQLIDSTKLILLTINYLNNSLIVKPNNFTITPTLTNNTKFIPIGKYQYAISYYSLTGESDISYIKDVTITNLLTGNQNIIITLPISDNKNIIGRKIYRTKVNSDELLLLINIENNINTTFIDNIQDDELGIDYINGLNIKLNKLPNISTNVTKTLVTIIKDNTLPLYYMKDTNGNPITLPNMYDNINEIYLEIFHYPYEIINSTNFDIIDRCIKFNSNYDSNYLYYLINSNNSNNFNDNIKLVPSYEQLSLPNEQLCELSLLIPDDTIPDGKLSLGTYKYKLSLYNTKTLIETIAIDCNTIDTTINNSFIYLINFYEIQNKKYNSFRIYRTLVNNNKYYLLDTITSIYNYYYCDIISDNALENHPEYIEPFFYITNTNNDDNTKSPYIEPFFNVDGNTLLSSYAILKIKTKNIAPNLYNYISHTADYEYINNKQLSDLNDFVFNKPFIMLVNNTESLYFYNINFKVNNTSIITINDMVINYMMPLSTQQFFIRDIDSLYYSLNTQTNTTTPVNDYSIVQLTFNPSFDEFNTPINILKTNFYPTFIDNLIQIYDKVSSNNDYTKIIQLIDSINNKYVNTLVNFLNSESPIYGFLSISIFNNIPKINKHSNLFNYKTYNYDTTGQSNINQTYSNTTNLIPYIQNDFMSYQYNNLRLIDNDMTYEKKALSTLTFIKKNNIMVLSPIYKSYLSKYRLSDNLILYLNNVSELFTNHLQYINDNIDYLNISNPNNIKNEYMSISEINQNISNNYYDYSNSTIITTLHPIIDTNIYNISIVDQQNNIKQINNFSITSNNEISTLEYIDNKIKDNFNNSELLITNTISEKPDKFNYCGIINYNLDFNNIQDTAINVNVIFNDDIYTSNNFFTTTPPNIRKFKFDDGKIYTAELDTIINRYKFKNIISDCLIVNPVELINEKIGNAPKTIEFNKLISTIHIYGIKLQIDPPTIPILLEPYLTTIFYIDGKIINGIIKQIDPTNFYLYICHNNTVDLTFKQLIYLNNYTDINTLSILNIKDLHISEYKKANWYAPKSTKYSNSTSYTIEQDDILKKDITTYYSSSDIFMLDNPDFIDSFLSGYYMYIPETINIISQNIITSNKLIFVSPTIILTLTIYKKLTVSFDSDNSYITHILQPSMTLKSISYNTDQNYSCHAYSNFIDFNYTKILLDTPELNYVLFVDLELNRHYMMQKQNILNYNIPIGNYHTWILPQTSLNLIEYTCSLDFSIDEMGNIKYLQTMNLPEYCYYMVRINKDNVIHECIYYYEKGDEIYTNTNTKLSYTIVNNIIIPTDTENVISYYENMINTNNSTENIKIYLIDNAHFNTNNKQLINSNKTSNIGYENYVSKNIIKSISNPNLYFDTIENISFKSNYSQQIFDINSFNNNTIDVNGETETTSDLILGSYTNTNVKLYMRLIISKYVNIPLPVLDIEYNSYIVINTNSINLNTPIDTIIIDESIKLKSLSPYISINNTNQIFLTNFYTNNDKLEYELCKIQVTYNNQDYQIYIWLLFTNNSTIYDNYTKLFNIMTIQIQQPIYCNIDGNINSIKLYSESTTDKYNLLYENIIGIDQTNNNEQTIKLKSPILISKICYKYYCDTRNINVEDYTHEIKQLNYNSLLNIKPLSQVYTISTPNINKTTDLSILHDKASFFILTLLDPITQKKIHNIIQHRTGNNISSLNSFNTISAMNNSSLCSYTSLQNPFFVKNKICLIKINPLLYKITDYDKLYLQQDEIICINLNYFYVKGLNHFDDTYELEPIRYETECELNITNFGSNLTFENNGYYTFGVYSTKNNKELPNFNKQNIMKFTTSKSLNIGDIYHKDNELLISTQTITTSNETYLYGKFTEKSLKLKLLHYNKRFYLFDNFVKLKIRDKILLVKNPTNPIIFTINNIRDNEIIFIFNLDDTTLVNNTFNTLVDNTFYDFILPYQPFDAKYININEINNLIKNNTTILIESENNSYNILNVNNNSLSGYMWVLFWDTNYTANFNNYMTIPKNFTTSLTNNHPIKINVIYELDNERYKLIDPSSFISTFTWFYNQSVKIFGTYKIIRKIEYVENNYYLYLTESTNTGITDNINSTFMIISSSESTESSLFYLNKFRYNYSIELPNYDQLYQDKPYIEVVRCALKNDQLIFIEKTRNTQPIKFQYGISITDNEINNEIDSTNYTNIYFYNYRMINSDGTINNFDTLIGTYFLLCEKSNFDIQRIHLFKIKDGNKIKIYTKPLFLSSYSYTLCKLISIKINVNGNFVYGDNQIVQVKEISNNNMQPIEIIKQYFISFTDKLYKLNNKYYQDIIFNQTETVDTSIYNQVFTDTNLLNTYIIIKDNNKYTLQSDTYINNINIIYTKNINYLVQSLQQTKQIKSDKNLNDDLLDLYINTKVLNTEEIVQNILISKINPDKPEYKFKLIDNSSLILNITENYKIKDAYLSISDFNNSNNILSTKNFIDDDNIEINNDYYMVQFLISYTIDNLSNLFNSSTLFTDVKQLRQQLFLNSYIDTNIIYNYLKPWKTWSILSSANTTTSLQQLINKVIIKYEISSQLVTELENTAISSYLTNNEVNILKKFIFAINTNTIYLQNYESIKIIEPIIISQISNWISQPDFFLNVVENINLLLQNHKVIKDFNVFFDGNNIIFKNDLSPPLINIDGEQEIEYYLSNEYICEINSDNTQVYRNITNYNQISEHIVWWINTNQTTNQIPQPTVANFGVRICKLLRYLRILGDNLTELFNNFTKPLIENPDYFYNSPIKFLLEKIWEKYQNNETFINLDKEFTDNIIVTNSTNSTNQNNIYSYIELNSNINIVYYGLANYANAKYWNLAPYNDVTINFATELQPTGQSIINIKNILNINPIYKYKLNVNSDEILKNSTYTLDFLSGDNTLLSSCAKHDCNISSNINISNVEIFPEQINFTSEYNIKPTDFFVLVQKTIYNIISTKYLGYLYNITFNITKDDIKYIENIYYKGLKITINKIFIKNDIYNFTLLLPVSTININDIFEIINENILITIKITKDLIGDYVSNLTFLNNLYIPENTYIEINKVKHLLFYEDSIYFIKTTTNIFSNIVSKLDHDVNLYTPVNIITQIKSSTTPDNKNIQLIEYELYPPFNDISYIHDDNNFITATDFILPTQPENVTPLYVYSRGNNKLIFYFNQDKIDFLENRIYTTIIHNKKINQNIYNEVISLTASNDYLYYIKNTYSKCSNIIGYIYTNNVNKYNPEQVNYINQSNGNTYFTTNKLNELNKYGFIQKNIWTLDNTKYTINTNILTIIIPSDFVFIIDNNIYYTINTTNIETINFSIINNNLTIIIPNNLIDTLTNDINLCQSFVDNIGFIFKPKLNRKYTANIGFKNQYSPLSNFYYMPYSGTRQKFNEILYKIKISDGFGQNIENNSITLISNNMRIVAKIVYTYNNNGEYYIISLPKNFIINTGSYYYYTTDTFDIKPVLKIEYYQEMLQYAQFYKQTTTDSIELFMSDEVNEYIFSTTTQLELATKFYLIDYNKTTLTNLFYTDTFVQNNNMQKTSSISYGNTKEIIKPEWKDYTKFFSKICMYFNDQLIEELNENIFNIDYYLYSTDEKRNQINKMCKISFINNKWEIYIPLIFWYNCKGGLAIPTIAMPYTEIRLEYTLNDVTYVLNNNLSGVNYQFTKIPLVNISLITDYILLDTHERKLFGTYSHEYIIDRYKIYSDTIITNEQTVLKKNFSGLIKDIHMITKPTDNLNITYYPIKQTKYDAKYQQYIIAYQYYLDLIVSKIYTSNDQKNYAIDIKIIHNIILQISNYITSSNKQKNFNQINRIINIYSGWDIWDTNYDLLKYLMYFENKYLSNLSDSKKEYVLTMYLKYQFSNLVIINEISLIKSLLIKANGANLFAERDYTYFTDVIPYQKFKNSLPIGYYTYTFSLYPLDNQHSGHLNFSNFDDTQIIVTSNINNNPYILSTVVKEYNILRIMSGLSSLAWI
jgi:hypothetical protein